MSAESRTSPAVMAVATNGRGHGRCGAKKRQGAGTCGRPAGWGTDHVGTGRCKFHGGNTPSHRGAAQTEFARRACNALAILVAMPESWRAFFTLLAQSGLRIGELLGLTWENVHLGDDAHILVAEQVYRGQRKRLKTDASMARVPLSPMMASWLAALRPEDASPKAPVFPSKTGTPLGYSNVYHRVLQPALRESGIAVQVGERQVVKRGKPVMVPVYDYQGVAFHAFRKACGSLLLHHGKTLKQVQGWLRHAQLTTTLNVYVQQVDDGLGGADVWDDIGATWGHPGATEDPQLPADVGEPEPSPTAYASQIGEQPQLPADTATHF